MKAIIMATDYSDASKNAAAYAAALAGRIKAKLILYHAFYMPYVYTEIPVDFPGLKELEAEHLKRLENIGTGLSTKYGVKIDYYTSPRPVIEELPELVTKKHAHLVVMGIRGLNAFERIFFGSTTVDIIRQAKFPVLVVPEEATYQDPARILLACDFQLMAQNNKLTLLKELAQTFHSHVQIVQVERGEPSTVGAPTFRKKLPNMERLLEDLKHEYLFLEEEDILDGIEKSIQEYKPAIVAMIPREHDFLDVVFNRSSTRKLAFKTHLPLLTLPNPMQ